MLDRPCGECGLDTARVDRTEVASLVLANAARWVRLLSSGDGWVHARPQPHVWSPLEYACHVRDVLRLYRERLALMLSQDDPLFANWNQDATAVEQQYASAEAAVVADEVRSAADAVARAFSAVTDAQWRRTGRRSDGASFTVESFARYFVHDPLHHLWDVTGERAGPTTRRT